jgi:diguanylate cyclase (GGDEF)-like protein/PAS domain S-box-containing protein
MLEFECNVFRGNPADSDANPLMTPTEPQILTASTAQREPGDLGRDVFDHEQDEHLDAETLEKVLEALLEMYPDAAVGAHSADGVMVPMPDSIPLRSNPILEARTALDLAITDENIMRGWERAVKEGAARYPVHPAGHPDLTLMVYALDLRENHGVVMILCVLAPADADERSATRPQIPEVKPRFARITKDMRGLNIEIDEATTQILGWTAEEMLGSRGREFMHPDDQALAVDNWMEMLASPGPGRRVRLRYRHKDGSWVWFEVTNNNLLNDPDHRCVVSEMVDISEEMAAHELLDRLAQTIPVGLFQVDTERRIVYTNERLHEILGVERQDTVEAQLAGVAVADRPVLHAAIEEVFESGLQADVEVELQLPGSGELRFCTVSLRALGQANGATTGVIACVADITDSACMREELKRQATFDELTGCYNRASIMRALEEHIASGERQAERAVVFVDVDLFKAINDQHGHAVGDQLLSDVAQRLQSAVRDGDMVGRIGGDEFLIVCPEIGGPEEAMKLARRLADAQRLDVLLPEDGMPVQVSIGVAWSSGEGGDADTLVAEADKAMYASKRQGVGRPELAGAAVAR